jgi:hypothetical protein
MLFDDPPAYYDHPHGFLVFDMDIPEALLANAGTRPGRTTDIKQARHVPHHATQRATQTPHGMPTACGQQCTPRPLLLRARRNSCGCNFALLSLSLPGTSCLQHLQAVL